MSKLYLVPTPIGNLEDFTHRAVRILKEVDLILAEDTRTSGKLLKHYGISKKLLSYHIHNEHKSVGHLVDRISTGESMALISDAGTPAISDPGFLLVRECIKNNIEVDCLPGPTAFIPALVNSGLPNDRFHFEGFLPHKKGRQTRLIALAENPFTTIYYESPHRLVKSLKQFAEFFGEDRQASVSREISKMYEETIRGTLSKLYQHFEKKVVKGEIVMVIAGKTN
ncbi:MAG: 16S rRNA (cytidine(1402)-2'-O)-methyltransferase [Bacteroidales bacterium]|jgi:16S rRNA (cytidine1402-2'-O)-methyltransferase|nr:16S rRNA (cytidine(1402)-2'-O)-methyltransferase [Bacteroidales bacterium]